MAQHKVLTFNNDAGGKLQYRLKKWLREQMKLTGYSQNEVSRRSNGLIAAHSSVGRALDPDELVSYHVVAGLSVAFNHPIRNLLEMADLLPKEPEQTKEVRHLTTIYGELDEAKRRELIWYAEQLRAR